MEMSVRTFYMKTILEKNIKIYYVYLKNIEYIKYIKILNIF